MRKITLPGTDLTPTVLAIGSVGFGSHNSQDDSLAILDAYAAGGGNFIDTAHVYGDHAGVDGASERTIGRWARQHGREGMIIATKGGNPDLHKPPHKPRLRPEQVIRDLEVSLDRLGMDFVDFYWFHRDDRDIPVDELIGVVNELRGRGWLRAFGASNWSAQRLAEAAAYAERAGLHGFSGNQLSYNLAIINDAVRLPDFAYMQDADQQAYHRSSRLPAFAFNAQAQGFFGDHYDWAEQSKALEQQTERTQFVAQYFLNPTSLKRLERAKELAKRHNTNANGIALAWVINNPLPSVAIVGPQSVAQIQSSLAAAGVVLSEEERDYLTAGERA